MVNAGPHLVFRISLTSLGKMGERTQSLQFYTLSGGLSTSSSSVFNSPYTNNLRTFCEDWGTMGGLPACACVAKGN